MGIRSISAWRQIQNWRAGQGQANDRELGNIDAANNSMSSAMSSYYSGLAKLAGQSALLRLQNAIKAKSTATTQGIDQALASLPPSSDASTGTVLNTTA